MTLVRTHASLAARHPAFGSSGKLPQNPWGSTEAINSTWDGEVKKQVAEQYYIRDVFSRGKNKSELRCREMSAGISLLGKGASRDSGSGLAEHHRLRAGGKGGSFPSVPSSRVSLPWLPH